MRDIKAMLPEEIAAALAEMGQPKYRAKQIFQWLARGASSFDEMTNLSKDLRAALAEQFYISRLEMGQQFKNHIINRLSGPNHQHNLTRTFQGSN